MKIEKLNDNKIKITLSSDDLKARNIDVHSFIYNTPESQDLFWDVMREAEKEYGFSIDESMIFVEASSTTSGIFTLTVTKTASSLGSGSLRNKIRKQNYKLKRKASNAPLDHSIYRFDNFDDFCDFCKIVSKKDFGENSLYEFQDNYYLIVSSIANHLILEYAHKERNTDILVAKLAEYGNLIAKKNAIKKISDSFVKSKVGSRKV